MAAGWVKMLTLQVVQTETDLWFDIADIDGAQGLIMGRSHPAMSTLPDIDLRPYDARDKGVSRLHAAILRHEATLAIVDLGSPNGTWLNDMPLFPHQPRVLQHGDMIRMGKLQLQVSIAPIAGAATGM